MKAEHRKELETNTLAEGVGHLMQRMKDRPRRSTVGWVIGGLGFLAVLFVVTRSFHMSKVENAERWAMFELSSKPLLDNLISTAEDTNPAKAARLEQAWIKFWEYGIKGLGHNPAIAIKSLDDAYKEYEIIRKQCEGDPTMEPEAIFGMAVIEETRALLDRKKLDKARELYEAAAKFDKSAFGDLAGKRLAVLKDEKKKTELVQFYLDLSDKLKLDQFNLQPDDRKAPDKKAKPFLPPRD